MRPPILERSEDDAIVRAPHQIDAFVERRDRIDLRLAALPELARYDVRFLPRIPVGDDLLLHPGSHVQSMRSSQPTSFTLNRAVGNVPQFCAAIFP